MRYHYSIWQRPLTDPKTFRPVNDGVDEVFLGEYVHVYDWETDNKEGLEDIYERFNVNHPSDYHARSLSISDLVYIRDTEKKEEYGYLVDMIGYQKVNVVASR